ncbi:MAG TPA: hypothetical protein VJJ26_01635 [Candidatus Babeliales bacterium]|nr:hypothetical protein [Candidatus Babeliales bacterium]
MKRILSCIALLFTLLTPVNSNGFLDLTIELTYECDSIFEFGDLSIKEFIVTPSKNTDSLSSGDIASLGAVLAAKNVALQAALMTKKDPEGIAFLNNQRQQIIDELKVAQLLNRKKELELELTLKKERAEQAQLNIKSKEIENEIEAKLLKKFGANDSEKSHHA